MTIIEIIIIYLACGSPFAVSRLLRNEGYFGLQNVLSSVGSLFGWPIFLPEIAKQFVTRRLQTKDYSLDGSDSDSRLLQLRKAIEKEWCYVFGEAEVIRFREGLERYINISLALLQAGQNTSPEFEVLDIGGHTDNEVGNACLSRRNKQKLETHRTASRVALVDAAFQIHQAGGARALEVAIELSKLVGDSECVKELESVRIAPSESSAMAA
jgi:hypothetical protein